EPYKQLYYNILIYRTPLNKYRIDEFIKRIQDKSASRYTLVSLSEQCGFSSRTSFFRSFKKFKGMSPAEYIKEHGIFIK
ncbi:helix-turn-helix domain-containing protein, partial [Phocaeicola dorei]